MTNRKLRRTKRSSEVARELGLTKNRVHRTAPSPNPNESKNHHFFLLFFNISKTIAKHGILSYINKYIFQPKIILITTSRQKCLSGAKANYTENSVLV